jgi:hypothetical protein
LLQVLIGEVIIPREDTILKETSISLTILLSPVLLNQLNYVCHPIDELLLELAAINYLAMIDKDVQLLIECLDARSLMIKLLSLKILLGELPLALP